MGPIRSLLVACGFVVACSSRVDPGAGLVEATPEDTCIRNAYPDETVCYPTEDWGTRVRSEHASGARLVGTRFPGIEQLDPLKPPRAGVSFADYYDPERRHARLLLVVAGVAWNDPMWTDNDVLALAEHGVRIVKVYETSLPPTETAHDLSFVLGSREDLAALGVDSRATTQTLVVDPRSMEILARVEGDPTSAIQPWLAWAMSNPPRDTHGAPASWSSSPACEGKCMSPPFGWRFIARGPLGVTCPAGTEDGPPIITAEGSPAACTCACDPTPLTPAQNCPAPGFVEIDTHKDALCNTNPQGTYYGVSGCIQNTNSYSVSSPLGIGVYTYVSAAPTTHATCGSPVTTSKVAPPLVTQGTECNPTTLFDACGADQVCMPPAKNTYRCIERDGEHDCPNEYPTPTAAGDGYTDTRACSQCTCGASEQCAGTLKVFSDTSCSNETMSLSIPSTSCEAVGTTFAPGSLTLSSLTPQATCKVDAHAWPIGAVSLKHPRTICCQF